MFETLLSVHCVRLTDRNDKEVEMNGWRVKEEYTDNEWARKRERENKENSTVKHQIPTSNPNIVQQNVYPHWRRIYASYAYMCADVCCTCIVCVCVCIRLILKNIIMYTVKVESHSVLCGIISHKVYREQFLCWLYFRRYCLGWFGISRWDRLQIYRIDPKMRTTRQKPKFIAWISFCKRPRSFFITIIFVYGIFWKNSQTPLSLSSSRSIPSQSLPSVSFARSLARSLVSIFLFTQTQTFK